MMLGPSKHYKHQPSAYALLFRSPKTHDRALRIACRAVLKEFTDNAYIGTGSTSRLRLCVTAHFYFISMALVDPQGILYYNNVSDLSGNCNYKVHRETDSEGYVYARIYFYHNSVSSPFAEVWLYILLFAPHRLIRYLDALLVPWGRFGENIPRMSA